MNFPLNWSTLVAIFIGGGAGSVARWVLGSIIARISSGSGGVGGGGVGGGGVGKLVGPLSVLSANILATALLAGLIIYGNGKIGRNSILMPMLTIGFCGGFSTFSTFSLDTLRLFQAGSTFGAITNILVSLIACLGIAWVILNIQSKA